MHEHGRKPYAGFASGFAYGGDGEDDLGGTGVPPWIANPYRLVSWWEMEDLAHTIFSPLDNY